MKLYRKFLLSIVLLGFSGFSHAALIGVWGGNFSSFQTLINGTGNSAVALNSSSTAADLAAVDQVWLIRTSGNATLLNYVSNGGVLITEWSAAEWAVDTVSMLNADVASISYQGNAVPVTFTQAGLDLGFGNATGNPYSNGGATSFFQSFTNIGNGVDIIATIAGGFNVGVSGAFGAGRVTALGWDWQDLTDSGASSVINGLFFTDIINSSVRQAADVSEPASVALLALALVGFSMRRKRK
ncbi:PEP-CTERM sorting domain-containing protein [Alteromonas sp. ASW11-36]|uniref:PEP-CTERM sorting domain-containing protein n=1 Tax=Alteromonas arenosi TaxID=3055817 RepID=A0ABT7SY53_9ALTE|nr:PEP-CTERM sorting domain-containing protein [Alteromonas sp. ASW11-36]MDM7861112.1 PEP-CTERM sorting domain-containing protein [Alteromonas sp. ASW11-36]